MPALRPAWSPRRPGLDDTATEIIRQLTAMGLVVTGMSDGPFGVALTVVIPSLENR